MTLQARIFDIQKYCLHDGPGIRTTVFFKGCPLECAWCSNPESQAYDDEIGYRVEQCIGCGSCASACPLDMITLTGQGIQIDKGRCRTCAEKHCVAACPARALVTFGRTITAEELVDEVSRDAKFYELSGGGVTASGGEPLGQAAFVEHFLAECKELGFHTAIETSNHVQWSAIERTIPYTDLYLCDLKHIDSEIFRKRTGGDLGLVMANITRLAQTASSVTIRIPLIPGFNDDDDTVHAVCRFVEQLQIDNVSLLPYHRLGKGKYAALGRPYAYQTIALQSKERIERLAQIPTQIGLRVQIGG